MVDMLDEGDIGKKCDEVNEVDEVNGNDEGIGNIENNTMMWSTKLSKVPRTPRQRAYEI